MKKLIPVLTFILGAAIAAGATWFVVSSQSAEEKERIHQEYKEQADRILKGWEKESIELKAKLKEKEAEKDIFFETFKNGIEVYKYNLDIPEEKYNYDVWTSLVNTLAINAGLTEEAICHPMHGEIVKKDEFTLVKCSDGAYSQWHALLREIPVFDDWGGSEEKRKKTEKIYEIVRFPEHYEDDAGWQNIKPSNIIYINPDEKIFLSFRKSRGIGDCGKKYIYQWDEDSEKMKVLEAIEQECLEWEDEDEIEENVPEAWWEFGYEYLKTEPEEEIKEPTQP